MVRNEKLELWYASGAKAELDKLLRDGTIPIDKTLMAPKVAYEVSQKFQPIEYTYFRDKLNDMRKKFKERRDWAEKDAAALAHDMRLYNRPTHTAQGDPLWDGHAAQALLKLDLPRYLKKKKKFDHLKPRDLYKTRPEYQEFKLKKFRKHLYQEVRAGKFQNYLKAKKKKAIQKKLQKLKVTVDLTGAGFISDESSALDDSSSDESWS